MDFSILAHSTHNHFKENISLFCRRIYNILYNSLITHFIVHKQDTKPTFYLGKNKSICMYIMLFEVNVSKTNIFTY